MELEEESSNLIKEVNIMKELKSDYIVAYYGSFLKDERLWVKKKNLKKKLKKKI